MSTKANFSTEDFNLQACHQLTETAPLGEDLYALKWVFILELLFRKVCLSPSKRRDWEEVAPLKLIYALWIFLCAIRQVYKLVLQEKEPSIIKNKRKQPHQ